MSAFEFSILKSYKVPIQQALSFVLKKVVRFDSDLSPGKMRKHLKL